MSQQKTLLVVCFLASVVALASAQSMDMQACQSKARQAAERYRETATSAGSSLTSSLQNAGVSATDISSMQEDIDKMTESMSSLTNMSNGFSVSTYTNAYIQNLQSLASIARKGARFDLISKTMGAWMDFGNTMMGANTQLMTEVTNACVPESRNYRQRVQQ